jgi:hypothetical protein
MDLTAALTHTAGAVVIKNRAPSDLRKEEAKRRRIFALFDIVDEMKGHVGGGSGVCGIQGAVDPYKEQAILMILFTYPYVIVICAGMAP